MASQIVDLQSPFINNPFCVLHLPANADPAEIQAKYAEARVSAQLDGDDNRLDRMLRAHSELLDIRSRWAYEATWSYDPPNCLFDGKIVNGDELLVSYQEQATRPGGDGIRGKHDLSNWLSLLAIHCDGDKKELTIRALSSWSELIESSEYRSIMASNGGQTPTRDQLWDLAVLSQFSLAAREEATLGNVHHVVTYIQAVQTTRRAETDVINVVAEALRQLCNRVHEARGEVQAQLDSVGDGKVALLQRTRIITVQATLLKTVLSALDDSDAETSPAFAECSSALDGAAGAIREIAISWFNDGGTASTGVDVLNEAWNIAATEFRRDMLSSDIAELAYSAAIDSMLSYSKSRLWNKALESARTALKVAPDEERRENAAGFVQRLYQLAAQPRQSSSNGGHPLQKIVGFVVVVGLIATCGVWTASQDGAQSRSEISYPSYTEQRLDSQINSNQVKLRQLENDYNRKLAEYEAICPTDGCTLPPDLFEKASELEIRLRIIESRYDILLRETNNLIARYNATR